MRTSDMSASIACSELETTNSKQPMRHAEIGLTKWSKNGCDPQPAIETKSVTWAGTGGNCWFRTMGSRILAYWRSEQSGQTLPTAVMLWTWRRRILAPCCHRERLLGRPLCRRWNTVTKFLQGQGSSRLSIVLANSWSLLSVIRMVQCIRNSWLLPTLSSLSATFKTLQKFKITPFEEFILTCGRFRSHRGLKVGQKWCQRLMALGPLSRTTICAPSDFHPDPKLKNTLEYITSCPTMK
jgi:hypothetical protein